MVIDMNILESNIKPVPVGWTIWIMLFTMVVAAFFTCFPNVKLSNSIARIYQNILLAAEKIMPVIRRIGTKIRNGIEILWQFVKMHLEKAFAFWRQFAIAIISFLVIILHIFSCAMDLMQGKSPDWALFLFVFFSLLLAVYAQYEKFWEKLIHRCSTRVGKLANYIIPALGSIILYAFGMKMVDGFADYEILEQGSIGYCILDIADRIFYISLCFIALYYVYRICKMICRSKHQSKDVWDKAMGFIICLFQIVQSFALVYIAIFHYFPYTFCELVGKGTWEVCLELTYHSAMTLWTGGSGFDSSGLLVHFVEMIETFIFAVFISYIVFGELSSTSSSQETVTYQVEIIDKSDSKERNEIDG